MKVVSDYQEYELNKRYEDFVIGNEILKGSIAVGLCPSDFFFFLFPNLLKIRQNGRSTAMFALKH